MSRDEDLIAYRIQRAEEAMQEDFDDLLPLAEQFHVALKKLIQGK